MKNTKKQYTFPDEAEIERVIKRTTQPGYRKINQGLWPDASEQDKVKYSLCKSILSYCDDNKLSEEELALKLGVDIPKVEYVLFAHYKKLTLEELIDYVVKLTGHLEVKVNYERATT